MSFNYFNSKWNKNAKNESASSDLKKMRKHGGTQVPELIFKITERLDRNLTAESLYRKPGNKEQILQLQKKHLDKVRFDEEDVHDLASWLKMILTELEEPLLPKRMFETFRENASQERLREELSCLEPVRRETASHVMRHVLRVVGKHEVNKMNKENMCIVWAPVVYYPLESREDADKCKEFFGVLMDIYAEEKEEQKNGGEREGGATSKNVKRNEHVKRERRDATKAIVPKKEREKDSSEPEDDDEDSLGEEVAQPGPAAEEKKKPPAADQEELSTRQDDSNSSKNVLQKVLRKIKMS